MKTTVTPRLRSGLARRLDIQIGPGQKGLELVAGRLDVLAGAFLPVDGGANTVF